jgi:hypothetical protein
VDNDADGIGTHFCTRAFKILEFLRWNFDAFCGELDIWMLWSMK